MSIFGNKKRVYLDYAASTPVDVRVVDAMNSLWKDVYANPRSVHTEGERARRFLDEARTTVGRSIGVVGPITEQTIVFTSGGTEANALAIRGVLEKTGLERGFEHVRFLTSPIEHASVLEIAKWLESRGGYVDFFSVNEEGIINTDDLKEKIHVDTVLISLQLVNSEIGTIQPVRECANKARELNPTILIHSDASQALPWMPVDVSKLSVDLLTIDAHKTYGPKGIGALYVKDNVKLEPLFYSTDDHVYRPGTPAVPLAVGFAKSIDLLKSEQEECISDITKLRDWCISELKLRFSECRINGSVSSRVANNISVTFPKKNHEFLQVALDERGFAVATRSACLERGGEGSVVLDVISSNDEKSALRITLGKETTKHNLETFISALGEILSIG